METSMKKLLKNIEHFLKSANCPLLVILGQTASGKTALSLKIAKKFGGEIVSSDSRQVYKGMDIGTDKISEKERAQISHHLIDIIDPDIRFTLADYQDLANTAIRNILKRKKLPILTGGTGLYMNAIVQNYEIPRVPPNEDLRHKLLQEAKKFGHEYLHEKLKSLDKEAAEKIHPKNLRYVIRAIEVAMANTSEKLNPMTTQYETCLIGINWDREVLYERINKRVEIQIKRGLLKEVEILMKKYDRNLPSMSSLGYKELVEFLQGKISYEQAIEDIKKNTRNYAKRQMTWFKKLENIHWLDGKSLEM